MNDHRISRRSFLAAAGMAGAAAALTACGGAASSAASSVASSAAASPEAAQSVELIVFAAASLTETLNAIGESYTAEHPEVTFRFNFDSSGTLKTQIQEGADCDLFISAGQKQMNQLDITASADVNKDGLDFVDADSRVNLLENKVTLAVPEGNPKGIESFDQLAELLKGGEVLLAMGNSDVPVGQYTLKIFNYYGIDETAVADKLTYGNNVKEVTSQVSEAAADCGIIYATDAFSAGLNVQHLRLLIVNLQDNVLEIQNDLRHIFLYMRNGRKLVQHTINLHGSDRIAGQRGEQHSPHTVAQGCAETSFQRFHHKLTYASASLSR